MINSTLFQKVKISNSEYGLFVIFFIFNLKKNKMKYSIFFLFILFAVCVSAQNSEYQVPSYLTEGTRAPNTHYIGEAWLNAIIHDDKELGYNITKATFKANSTLDWHKHSSAQVLIIVEGEAYYQERGNEPVILKEGDVIKCEKDIEHWHSSTKVSDVTYLALYGGGQPTTWTEVLKQEYYDSVAKRFISQN
ncbi:cupin domain-containing protein [Cyclobacteriaceae bacterium]|nr:cupin domain-containing protein [Cyclobacteriaceae bacterium]